MLGGCVALVQGYIEVVNRSLGSVGSRMQDVPSSYSRHARGVIDWRPFRRATGEVDKVTDAADVGLEGREREVEVDGPLVV